MTTKEYVHGYSIRENQRLGDQANTLSDFLHYDTKYPPGSVILEAGCGTGEQTKFLAKNNLECQILSMDISESSLNQAKSLIESENIQNVTFRQADIFHLPFDNESFDHVFVCFVLEHLPNPILALKSLKTVLKKGGSFTVIEGDHGSAYFYPDHPLARKTIQCLIDIQASMGGNSLIGRELFPLLNKVALSNISVSPRLIYVDGSKPALIEGFTKNTFIAMVEGAKDQALERSLMSENDWNKGIKEIYKSSREDGTFLYTFFKGIGIKE